MYNAEKKCFIKSVLITGGNRGLGLKLVSIFHKNNYNAFTVVRSNDSANYISNKFKNNIHPIVAELTSDNCIYLIKKSLYDKIENLDILINNAGIPGNESDINKVTSSEIMNLFNIHCLAVIRTTQACSDFLERSKEPRIINISSILGSLQKMYNKDFINLNTSYSYRIAKASQNMLSTCLSQQLSEKNITVN